MPGLSCLCTFDISRKEQCNFGWDWGIRAVTCGIWRDIRMIACNAGRLDDVRIRQRHSANCVDLDIQVSAIGAKRGVGVACSVRDNARVVGVAEAVLAEGGARLDVSVGNPKLWWPNTMGEQPLYEITINLVDRSGHAIDT